MITKITNNDLSEAKEKELAVLDFSATWCGPCKMLAPVLEHLADDMPNVSFYSIDVDENFPLSHEFGVSSIPCLVVLKHGQEVDRSVGFEPQPAIQAFLEKHLIGCALPLRLLQGVYPQSSKGSTAQSGAAPNLINGPFLSIAELRIWWYSSGIKIKE